MFHMNIPPSQWILTNYQDMGFSRYLIIQAWNQCQGNQHLLLNTLLRLCPRQPYIQQRSQNPRIKRIPNSVLIKKMPRIKHVNLRFEGDKALEYLELRKLGLFSKKAFKDAKSLTLEYNGKQILKNEHIEILANHMNRGLRKLKHFSIKLEMEREWIGLGQYRLVRMISLLDSMKQSFVSLTSLKLSLGKNFQFSNMECDNFERLFARIRSTLKHLDLDFSENGSDDITDSSEILAIAIMNRLHKLETLCLNFNKTKASTLIVLMLMVGACTHLTRLKSLDVSIESCPIVQEYWNLHSFQNFENNLQDLKLNFGGCKDLNLEVLTILQNDIVTLCPKLQRLFISTLNCPRYSKGFYAEMEEKFLQNLNLKWFILEYSRELENTWDEYQKTELLEMNETMILESYLLEKDRSELKEQDRIQKEIDDFLDMREKRSSDDDRKYNYDAHSDDFYEMENEENFEDRIEEEIRLRDLTQGGKVTQIYLDYGDSS